MGKKTNPWWPRENKWCPPLGSPELEALDWPAAVPFLVAADLWVRADDTSRDEKKGQRTLWRWLTVTFDAQGCVDVVSEALLSYLENNLRRKLQYHHLSELPPRCTVRTLAAGWNAVMHALGYEGEAAEEPATGVDAMRELDDLLNF